MSGVATQLVKPKAAQAVEASRSFKATLQPRLRAYREAADDGSIPEGSLWLVRVIESGKSLNGPIYGADALREAVGIFEGVPVFVYSLDGSPEADDAGHLDDATAQLAPSGLVGHQVGSLQDVHFNEEAQALDAYLKLYDDTLRTRMVAAYKLGDIGEGGSRDVFGLSIDANGDQDPVTGEVLRFTAATSVDVVSRAAAGGRIRRLIAALDKTAKGSAVKNKKLRACSIRLTEAVADLERAARMRAIFNEAMDQLHGAQYDEAPYAERAAKIAAVAHDLGEAFDMAGAAPVTTQEAVRYVEAAATFAAELKLLADALSAAPDDQATDVLEQIKAAVDDAVSTMGGAAPAPAEEATDPEEDAMATKEGANAQQDDFARMSAGLTEALKLPDLDPTVRAKLVEALGHEPNEDDRDREIRRLNEQLSAQAVAHAYDAILKEGVAVHDPDLVLSLIDRSKVKVNGAKVSGLKEAVESVLESKPYLRMVEAVEAPVAPAKTEEEIAAEEEAAALAAAEAEAAAAAAAVAPQAGAPAQGARTTEALTTGVSLRESLTGGRRAPAPAMTEARATLLRRRAMQGDVAAGSELRRARGHRW